MRGCRGLNQCLRGMVAVQAAQSPVKLHLLLGKYSQFGDIAAALSLCNQRPHVAQAALEGTLLDLLQCSLDFGKFGWLDFGQQSLCEQCPLGLVRRPLPWGRAIAARPAPAALQMRQDAETTSVVR